MTILVNGIWWKLRLWRVLDPDLYWLLFNTYFLSNHSLCRKQDTRYKVQLCWDCHTMKNSKLVMWNDSLEKEQCCSVPSYSSNFTPGSRRVSEGDIWDISASGDTLQRKKSPKYTFLIGLLYPFSHLWDTPGVMEQPLWAISIVACWNSESRT